MNCHCYIDHKEGDEEKIIQCSLCAAAADMYEALKVIKLDWSSSAEVWELRRKALAKARVGALIKPL